MCILRDNGGHRAGDEPILTLNLTTNPNLRHSSLVRARYLS